MNKLSNFLVIAGVSVIVLWQFIRPPFLSYTNIPFPVLKPVVHPGQGVPLEVGRCNSRSETRLYQTTRELMNVETGVNIVLSATTVALAPGCTKIISEITSVPVGTTPGKYKVHGTVEIAEVFGPRYLHWESQVFTVSVTQ